MTRSPKGRSPRRRVYSRTVFRERKFSFSLPVLAAFFFAGVSLTLYVMERGLRLPGLVSPPAVLLTLAIVSILFSAALRALFPVYAGPQGLRATDGVGRYQEVLWDDMRTVSNWPGFIHVAHGRLFAALMLPLFLEDSAGFREYVLTHAPEGNPLRAYLARR